MVMADELLKFGKDKDPVRGGGGYSPLLCWYVPFNGRDFGAPDLERYPGGGGTPENFG